ncbi:aspartate aminotransferase family protein [Candidatus Woesearchaeota archaeon]|nr:aspartate aminotransferase family protein [Candidatus Woesearchaeota archaeon]
MDTKKIINLEKKHIMGTYSRFNLLVDHGKGCYVYDKEGNKYLDLLGGIATCSVGHGNPEVAKAACMQAKRLLNITNLYYTEPQVELAEKLAKLSGLQKCFFCNSGAEANEAAVKLAKKITGKNKFIAFKGSFHGRTTSSLALTWNEKYRKPFEPLALDVKFAEYDDIGALEAVISPDAAAVIIEPIQGEAGVVVPKKGYLKKVEQLCRKNNVLLIADEVQSGTGRTGKFFAYLHENVKPDIATIAKGLANGIPIGACISDLEFDKGEHASTFGGNSLSCAAANAVIDHILGNNLMENAAKTGSYLLSKLEGLKKENDKIKDVRGKGLMAAVELNSDDAKDVVNKCLAKGLIINNTSGNTLRMLPPLIVGEGEIDEALGIIEKVL